MDEFRYRLAGVYPDRAAAERAFEHLVNAGVAPEQVRCAWPHDRRVERKVEPQAGASVRQPLRNGLVGGGVGALLGAVAAGLIAGFQEALFAAHPYSGPLAVIGYGALIGLVAGALSGLGMRAGLLATEVADEVGRGSYALVVQARSSREARQLQRLLDELPTPKKILH